jgi:hypothetical protein
MKATLLLTLATLAHALSGCAVYSVVSTAVSATATVVETTVDVAAGGVGLLVP